MFQGVERPKILVCSVCLGDHSDDLNEIVTCDGCSVSVHEGCYGISDSVSVSSTVSSCSTEPWFCDACKAGVVDPPCELCPNLGECQVLLLWTFVDMCLEGIDLVHLPNLTCYLCILFNV